MRKCPTCGRLWSDRATWARCCAEEIDRDALARMFPRWELLPEVTYVQPDVRVDVHAVACGEVWFGEFRESLHAIGRPYHPCNAASGEIST